VINDHFEDPRILAPSCALRFSINTGPNAFYGEKYKVAKVSIFMFLLDYFSTVPAPSPSKMMAVSHLELLAQFMMLSATGYSSTVSSVCRFLELLPLITFFQEY
jgi:hypothetical protein